MIRCSSEKLEFTELIEISILCLKVLILSDSFETSVML